ncbi:BON domain-containing protein [Allorhizobium pseudoryzae]|uniref:BON domain-containing protein n=1 Tax=Allorhizobium pseudoryzae TaxID=379684 RepID=UPI003D02ABF7
MVFKPQSFHEEEPVVEQEFPPDATLESRVASALASAGGLDATDVSVIAEGSVVTLRGTVLRAGEVVRAEEVALSVPGVSATVNDLRARQP